MILTKEQVEELWTPIETGMIFESEQDKNNLISTLRSVEAERDEAYKWIGKRWYVETEDGTKCFYCGEEVIDEDEQYRPKHPTPSTCIVLKCKEGI